MEKLDGTWSCFTRIGIWFYKIFPVNIDHSGIDTEIWLSEIMSLVSITFMIYTSTIYQNLNYVMIKQITPENCLMSQSAHNNTSTHNLNCIHPKMYFVGFIVLWLHCYTINLWVTGCADIFISLHRNMNWHWNNSSTKYCIYCDFRLHAINLQSVSVDLIVLGRDGLGCIFYGAIL